MMKCKNPPALTCPIGNIGASAHRWRRLVAFMKATNLLQQAMRVIYYRRIAMAIKTASKEGTFCIVVLLIVAMAAAGVIRSN